MKIFRSSSTIYFANVELYAEALKKKVGEPPATECFLCLLPACQQQGGVGADGDTGPHCFAERH